MEGRDADADRAYERARSIKERTIGPDDPQMAVTLERHALVLSRMGRGAEALELTARARRLSAPGGKELYRWGGLRDER